jgi:hypothetical protein
VFWAADAVKDADLLDTAAERRLEELCQWFNKHLPVPDLDSEH